MGFPTDFFSHEGKTLPSNQRTICEGSAFALSNIVNLFLTKKLYSNNTIPFTVLTALSSGTGVGYLTYKATSSFFAYKNQKSGKQTPETNIHLPSIKK